MIGVVVTHGVCLTSSASSVVTACTFQLLALLLQLLLGRFEPAREKEEGGEEESGLGWHYGMQRIAHLAAAAKHQGTQGRRGGEEGLLT